MIYIKLSDIKNMFWDLALKSRWDDTVRYIWLKDEILKFPSIDPEAMIKEMIDEKLSMMQDNPYFHPEMWIDFLEELLQKFKS